MGWSGKRIKDTFKDLLKINSVTDNAGVDSTLRRVQDGNGNNTGLKLSSTAVDANILTSEEAVINNLSAPNLSVSTNADIDGGTLDSVNIGLQIPGAAVVTSLGINGSPSIGGYPSEFGQHTTENNSNVAKAVNLFRDQKMYHELHGYFTVNIDNKFNWTGLEFLPTNHQSKGSAWWELELFVDESDSKQVANGGGSGYTSPPPGVKVVPRASLECFGNADGAWTANTAVYKKARCVYWGVGGRDDVGYVFSVKSISGNAQYAHTGANNPFATASFSANDYTAEVTEGDITWEYIGLTANITPNLSAGSISSYDIENDYESDPTITIVSRFEYQSVSSDSDWANDACFFNVATHNDGSEPITLERGLTGGTAASTVGINYSIGVLDASEGNYGWYDEDHIWLTLKSGGNGTILNGDDWAVCQRNATTGSLIRHVKVKASTRGGRAGGAVVVVDAPASGITAVATTTTAAGYAADNLKDTRGIYSAEPSTHIGEQDPGRFIPNGERSYFGTYKGFILSRDGYNHDLGSVVEGCRRWWTDPRQKEYKKAKILDGIKYGHTNLGHMHNFDPTLIEKHADANQHAKNKFDQAAGRIYTLSGSDVTDWAITEDTTKRIFFHSPDGSEEKLFSTLSFGGNADFNFCKSVWDTAYDAEIGGGGSVDDAIIEAKAAILDWPNFGNLTGGFDGGTRPGGHCQLNPVMFSALDILQVSSTVDGVVNLTLPEGSNEGSFYIVFSSNYTGNAQELGIGYRLKCWTTPGYIANLRRTVVKFD